MTIVNGKAIFVAPKQEWSSCGHGVTNNASIHIEKRSQFAYAVGETGKKPKIIN